MNVYIQLKLVRVIGLESCCQHLNALSSVALLQNPEIKSYDNVL